MGLFRLLPGLLAIAAIAAVATGCGGSSSGAGVARLGTTTSDPSGSASAQTNPSRQDFQTAILAYTKCMRGNGINLPDPTFNSAGGPGAGAGGRGLFGANGVNRNSAKFRKAQSACGSKLAAVRPQFNPQDRQRLQDAALKFAQCMRKNGVDVPDPDFSQEGQGGGGLFAGSRLNQNDPKVRKAISSCRSVFTDAGLGRGGPGGGPPPAGG
jgi:hypothetical protein